MRKHFLLLFLMALLPLAGWAADGDITEPTAVDLTYTGGNLALINAGAVEGADYELRYALVTSATATPAWSDFSTTIPTGKDAGTYYVFFASYNTATEVHSAIGPKISVVINKADIALTAFNEPVGKDGLTYKGKTEAQALIQTAATWTGATLGTFQYKLGENGSWTTEISDITAINANTTGYDVYYKIVGDKNHNDRTTNDADPAAALKISVAVAKKALPANTIADAYSFTATNPTYNGYNLTTAKLPVFTAVDGDDALVAGTDYEITWHKGAVANAAETPKDAGTYYLKITGTGNYTDGTVTKDDWNFTVNRKAISIYVEDKHMTYNNAAIPTTAEVAAQVANPGEHFTQDEIDAAQEGDPAYGKTTADWKVEPSEAVEGVPFHINEVSIMAPGLTQPDIAAGLKDDLYAKFETATYNNNVPKDYAANGYAMVAFTKTAELWSNYDLDDSSFGAYYIDKRQVTVTVRNQGPFTYTGAAIATSTGNARAEQTIWLKPVVYNGTTNPVTDGTITIETQDDVNGTGLIAADNATFLDGLTLSLTADVITVGTADNEYANYIQVSGDLDNYTVAPVNGGVTVAGKPLKVIATSITDAVYGAKLNDFTFGYRTNPSGQTLKEGIEYKVYDADEVEVTDYDAILDAGTYTIKITENAALAPDNYTITAFMEGELIVAQKRLDITIDDVALNTGDTQTELTKYASINADYKDDLVTDADIDVAVIFDATNVNLLKDYDDDPQNEVLGLKSAGEYTTGGWAFWTAATNTLTGVTVLNFDATADANKNYDIHFTAGNIVLGGDKTLKLDITNSQLASKIADAAAACTADANVKYNVEFGAKTMVANEWYPMVLPFPTSAYDLVKQLGQYVVINTYGDDTTPNDIKFHLEMGDIAAGVPFLIKAGAELNWNGKKFDTRTIVEAPVAQGNLNDNGSIFTGVFSTGNVLLNGYELDGTTADADLAYRWLSNSTDTQGWGTVGNYWRGATADDHHKRSLSALEAYLQIKVGTNARITVEDFDGQTTSIKTLSAGDMKAVVADGWYTLDGIKLQSAPTQKGIYINNGKKVVLK